MGAWQVSKILPAAAAAEAASTLWICGGLRPPHPPKVGCYRSLPKWALWQNSSWQNSTLAKQHMAKHHMAKQLMAKQHMAKEHSAKQHIIYDI